MNKHSWFVAATVAVTIPEFCSAVDGYLRAAEHARILREIDAAVEKSIKLRLGRV